MRAIAVINRKGGVGKTTTAANLGHALALAGRRVLLLDLDPQGHLGASFGLEPGLPGMDQVLLEGRPLTETAVKARDRLHLVPAGPRLEEVEHLRGGSERGRRLAAALEETAGYDFLLADCPPAAALLTCNALFACSELLLPVPGDYLSLQGFSAMLQLLRSFEARLGRPYRKRLALTRFHPRRRLAREIHTLLKTRFPHEVLATPVRECAALAEGPGLGKTIFEHRRASAGAADYRSLAEEVLQ